jgi:5,10-methylenetetrahydromethanopterin reductase
MMRFGLSLGVSAREPLARAVEVLRQADAGGIDCAWVIDSQLIMKDAYVVLTLAAGATHHLRLGTGVTNPITRHLTVTANAAAALREASDGRFVLGLGAGDSAVYPLGRWPASLRTCREAIETIRTLLDGKEAGVDGRRLRLATAAGPVPIFLAASQPKMLGLAGQVADGVIVLGIADPDFTRQQIAIIREGAAAAGRLPGEPFVDLWVTVSVSADRAAALNDVRSWASTQARWIARWKTMPAVLQPFAGEIAAAAAAYDFGEHLSRRAGHRHTVSDGFTNAVAVAGPREECVARLRALAATGVDRITVTLLSGGRTERLRVLCEEVFPGVN